MTVEDIVMPDGAVVGQCIINATFEEWISHVFEHNEEEGEWWHGTSFTEWRLPASNTVAFLKRTFRESGSLLKGFSEKQAGEGLYYITDLSRSNIASSLADESVPIATRCDTIAALRQLYSDCFNVRCEPRLSYLDETRNPLNGICYMLWDVLPVYGHPENESLKQFDNECLAVMEFALGLSSDACRESALHGLGHWSNYYPENAGQSADKFIQRNPNARSELIAYATKARTGDVL